MSGGKSSGTQSQKGKSNSSSTSLTSNQSSATSPFASALEGLGLSLGQEGNSLLQPWIEQLQSALSGNYTKGTIPLVNNAVGAQRSAGAQSYNQAKANLSQTGASRSPFAATALSGVESSANEAIGAAPTNTVMGLLSGLPSAVGTALGGAGSDLSNAIKGFMNYNSNGQNYGWGAGTSSGSGVATSKGEGFSLGDLAGMFNTH